MIFRDIEYREPRIGDTIAYAVRRGSWIGMRLAVVQKVNENNIKAKRIDKNRSHERQYVTLMAPTFVITKRAE